MEEHEIGMIIISWVMAITMLFGYLAVKLCEKDVKDENLDDKKREIANVILNQYNGRNFAGRVAFILFIGCSMVGNAIGMLFLLDKKGGK